MAWFFTNDALTTEYYTITGEDASHIARSLRMKVGEELTLCTPDGRRHECEITEITRTDVTVRILSSTACEQEPDVHVHLLIALMKGDKIDDVVQKAVELGASEITPFLSARCISRPDEKGLQKKRARWQKIADNAASQSRRGIIPRVNPCIQPARHSRYRQEHGRVRRLLRMRRREAQFIDQRQDQNTGADHGVGGRL